MADYSIGGFANGARDLLTLLGVDRATVVGHSLGGGIAMQFASRYPEIVERLVLVASGGLGNDVTPLLRLGALPGASAAIGASLELPNRISLRALMADGGQVVQSDRVRRLVTPAATG